MRLSPSVMIKGSKNPSFKIKSKYLCEMMKGDLEINTINLMWGRFISSTRKICLSITRIKSINTSILKVTKFKLRKYSIMDKISILNGALLCDVIYAKFNDQIITGIKTNLRMVQ